jgi:hypothetical protein
MSSGGIYCCDHPASPDRHVAGCPTLRKCPLCSWGGSGLEEPEPRYAVWLHSRGWLVDTCGSSANVADRLYGATWFSTEEEARVALEAVERLSIGSVQYLSELGEVVTL